MTRHSDGRVGTVLVTGATGLLGSTLCPALGKSCNRVVTQGRRGGGADFAVDLLDRSGTDAMLASVRPSTVINLVGLTNVDRCETVPDDAYRLNVRTVETLVAAIGGTVPACHLIHVSTDQVYDDAGPHAEAAPTIRNVYALSKYAGELAAAVRPATVLRTNFFGRSRVPGRVSLTDWLYGGLRGDEPVPVFEDVLFSPLSIATLAEMIALAVEKRPRGVFNVGSRDGMSKADFAFRFAECLELDTRRLRRTTSGEAGFLKAYRPKDMRMDCAKFEGVIGVPMPTLREEILKASGEYHDFA